MADLNKKVELRRGPQDATDFLSKKVNLNDTKSFGKAEEEKEKEPQRNMFQRLKDNIMGTEEQNRMAEEREIERARKNPEGNEAKFRKATGKPFKSGGKVSSASKRADGCAMRGKTKGRMI
jgi:hypothetical protein